MSFDPGKDFAPVALIASVPIVLAVHPDVKAKTVGELVALAKAAPGTMNFGSSGNGSTNHLAGELFKARAGIDIVHIPYRGAAPAMNDLIAGQIQMMFDNILAIRPQVIGGTIRGAGGWAPRARPLLGSADHDRGRRCRFRGSSWFGRWRPPPRRRRCSQLTASVGKVLQDPDVVKRLAEIGAEPGALSGAAFGAFLRSETEKWGKVATSAGVKLDQPQCAVTRVRCKPGREAPQ